MNTGKDRLTGRMTMLIALLYTPSSGVYVQRTVMHDFGISNGKPPSKQTAFLNNLPKAGVILRFIKQIAYSKTAYVYMKKHFV